MSQDNFEESLKRLEEIVQKLEEGEVTLSYSISLFEEGMIRAKECHQYLHEAQERIQVLMEDEKGELVLSPFNLSSKEEGGD